MFGKNVLRVVGSLALAAMIVGSTRPARADDAPGSGTPAPAPVTTTDRPWQQLAFRTALVGSGLGLVSAVGFRVAYQKQVNAFNDHRNPRCTAAAAGNGGPPCDRLLARSETYRLWSNVGLASAGALAIGAVVLKLIEPAPAARTASASTRLACAPGLGPNFSCLLVF